MKKMFLIRMDECVPLMILPVLAGMMGCSMSDGNSQVGRLTPVEEAQLRKAVYGSDLALVKRNADDPQGRRVIVVPAIVEQYFEAKPAGTLECLLKIVEGGRPVDAKKAAAFAYAVGDVDKTGWQFFVRDEEVDKLDEQTQESVRQTYAKIVQSRIRTVRAK